MIVLKAGSSNVLKILGRNNCSPDNVRKFTYCVETETDQGVLLYNVLTRELVYLNKSESDNRYNIDELRDKWFIVSKDNNDKQCAKTVRFVNSMVGKKENKINKYVIFPTTDCNARCFYCYELGRSRVMMSEDIAKDVANYIISNYKGTGININWFGGEPLYNASVISTISSMLKEHSVDFTGSMVSNGFLFDKNNVELAKSLWNINSVQISLDGTEKIYNKSKAYIYKNVNPFQTVINNINNLIDNNIFVTIRLNVGEHNCDDLMELVKYLHDTIGDKKGICIYSSVLFEYSGNKLNIRTDEQRRVIYSFKRKLDDYISTCGYTVKKGLKQQLPLSYCMADSGRSITILPDGHVGLCEHFTENEFIGSIYEDGFDQKVIESWREYREEIPECDSCFYYPECYRLKKCLEMEECHEFARQEKKNIIISRMINEYNAYKLSKKCDEEENDNC